MVVDVRGNPESPTSHGKICIRGIAGIMQLYDPYLVKTPLIRTNPKKGPGVDPGWKEISWDEAINIAAEKIKKAREKDPYSIICSGWPQYASFFWITCFPRAVGTVGGFYFSGISAGCGSITHTVLEIGRRNFLDYADIHYTNYLMMIGTGQPESMSHPLDVAYEMSEARMKRGAKIVVVDPRQTWLARKAHRWIPIRPATDGAFLLSLLYVIIYEIGKYDVEFLKKETNAPYLVGPDGYFVRVPYGKAMMWDPVDNKAKPFDAEFKDIALEGSFEVEGIKCKPAFQIFKEIIKEYTPEWAENITTVPAKTIREVAKEIIEASCIGQTITLNGKQYRYRPFSIWQYRGANTHTNAIVTIEAMELLRYVTGSIFAVGGSNECNAPVYHWGLPPQPYKPGEDGMPYPDIYYYHEPHQFTFPARRFDLGEFFPLAFDVAALSIDVVAEREKYPIKTEPEVLIVYRGNPIKDNQNPEIARKALEKIPFIVQIGIYLDEVSDYADIVLPEHTYLERYRVNNFSYDVGLHINQPVLEKPLRNSRDGVDILIDIAERAGFLYGERGLNWWYNVVHRLKPPHILDLNKKYTHKEIVDINLKSILGKGLDEIAKRGFELRPPTPEEFYGVKGNLRLPFYLEFVKKVGDELKKNLDKYDVEKLLGVEPGYLSQWYMPLPVWKPAVIHEEPPEYDLYAVNYKSLCAFSHTNTNPLLMEYIELEPYIGKIWMNAETCRKKGLKDGDVVWVESKVGRVKGVVKASECIHHECVGIAGNFGSMFEHPIAKGKYPHFNALLPRGIRYQEPVGGAMEMGVRVKVYKA